MTIKACVFEGSGITGISYAGAVSVFEERGLLKETEYFIGSSSGSLPAAMLALNASATQMQRILCETDFSQFQDDSFGLCQDVYRLVTKFGWYKGEYIERWFGQVLAKIADNSEITFREAFEKTGKTLVITTTDLTLGQTVYQSHLTTPNLKIKKAVRRSMSLPLFYKPDRDTNSDAIEQVFADGGLLDNYPIEYFDELLDDPQQTVGFKQMTNLELNQLVNPYISQAQPVPPANLKDYTMRCFILLFNKNFKIHQSAKNWERTVKIDTDDYSSIDFSLSKTDKEFLIVRGRQAAEQYIQKSIPEAQISESESEADD